MDVILYDEVVMVMALGLVNGWGCIISYEIIKCPEFPTANTYGNKWSRF